VNLLQHVSIGSAAIVFVSGATPALARPTTYPGGNMLMAEVDDGQMRAHVVHTLTPRFSLGLEFEGAEDGDTRAVSLMSATLLGRRNGENAQANAYLTADIGAEEGEDGKTRTRLDTALDLDWENRRFYTAYRAEGRWIDGGGESLDHRLRFGVAPYVGDFGDLHIWGIVQADWREDRADRFSLTPVLRAFKGLALVELGADVETEKPFVTVWLYF
jgi:hypothetical protein